MRGRYEALLSGAYGPKTADTLATMRSLLFFHLIERLMMNVYIQRKRYGFWNFVGDCLMVGLTGGFWLIWIFVREMRKR